MEQNNVVGLFNNIRPHLRKALQTVYLREVSSRQWEIAQEENPNAGSFIVLVGIQKVRSLWKGGRGKGVLKKQTKMNRRRVSNLFVRSLGEKNCDFSNSKQSSL